MTTPTHASPLADVEAYVEEGLDDGVTCPACHQYAKRYRRALNTRMAAALIKVYRHAGRDYTHVASIAGDGCEFGKLRYWGLVEQESAMRPDGGRSSWWRVTDLGEGFLRAGWQVPKYAVVYNGECLGLDGPRIDIREALSTRFSFDALMRA